MAAINQLLERNNLPPHLEPEQMPALVNRAAVSHFPYSSIHRLRRIYAHWSVEPDWSAMPVPDGVSPLDDPVLTEAYKTCKSHLLCHSDAEGYYLPIRFSDVLIDETQQIPGRTVGSSYTLLKELISIAPVLGIQSSNGQISDMEAERINRTAETEYAFAVEMMVWLALFETARLSITHKTVVSFG